MSGFYGNLGTSMNTVWDYVYGTSRNTSVKWGNTDGLRLFPIVNNGYTYNDVAMQTVVGCINTMHDLIGDIIVSDQEPTEAPEDGKPQMVYDSVHNKFYLYCVTDFKTVDGKDEPELVWGWQEIDFMSEGNIVGALASLLNAIQWSKAYGESAKNLIAGAAPGANEIKIFASAKDADDPTAVTKWYLYSQDPEDAVEIVYNTDEDNEHFKLNLKDIGAITDIDTIINWDGSNDIDIIDHCPISDKFGRLIDTAQQTKHIALRADNVKTNFSFAVSESIREGKIYKTYSIDNSKQDTVKNLITSLSNRIGEFEKLLASDIINLGTKAQAILDALDILKGTGFIGEEGVVSFIQLVRGDQAPYKAGNRPTEGEGANKVEYIWYDTVNGLFKMCDDQKKEWVAINSWQ